MCLQIFICTFAAYNEGFMDLSIIVPVYNVEKYIRPCIESIFKQGLDEDAFEVIIINDGTKDKSRHCRSRLSPNEQ